MKKITVYYDEVKFNKHGKKYHYVNVKAYTWLVSDKLAEKINQTKSPQVISVRTALPDNKPFELKAFIATLNNVSEGDLKKHKQLDGGDYEPSVKHANSKQIGRLNHLMEKLNVPMRF